MMELGYVQLYYNAIQNVDSFELDDNNRSLLMLTLFKMLLKQIRLLCDKGENHFKLSNWEEY